MVVLSTVYLSAGFSYFKHLYIKLTRYFLKVQELVLTLVEKLLIDRLRKFTVLGCDDPMPWMFLAGVMRRQKAKHLQKVCLMLSKSAKCIK